jgi:hypothetical protein
MFVTLRACADQLEAAELQLGALYTWVVRLRADSFYDFTWHRDSDWRPAAVPTVYSTHCLDETIFGEWWRNRRTPDNWCQPPYEQPCISDMLGVISRDALNPYFRHVVELYDARISSFGSLNQPNWTVGSGLREVTADAAAECKLGTALSRARVRKRALIVYVNVPCTRLDGSGVVKGGGLPGGLDNACGLRPAPGTPQAWQLMRNLPRVEAEHLATRPRASYVYRFPDAH